MKSVLDALAQGDTVLTPNRRLARHLRSSFDVLQVEQGRKAWMSPDVLPASAWLEREGREITLQGRSRTVLAPLQELAVWRSIIGASKHVEDSTRAGSLARLAREAYRLQVAWRIDPRNFRAESSADVGAQADWTDAFLARCRAESWESAARLADRLRSQAQDGAPLCLYAFDTLTPQDEALFESLRATGMGVRQVQPEGAPARTSRQAYGSREEEFYGVAQRIRSVLRSHPETRIGVVVPDLSAVRAKAQRIFDDVLEPGRILAPAGAGERPYNLSLGAPLNTYEPVGTALLLLQLSEREISLTGMGSLLLSPYLCGWREELSVRALIDAELRKRGGLRVSLQALDACLRDRHERENSARILSAAVGRAMRSSVDVRLARLAPSRWSDIFTGQLEAWGWPGEQALDSEAFQVVEKFREVLRSLALLDPVLGTQKMSEALGWLYTAMSETVFQPESEAGGVQILGVLESAGLPFDLLFVTHLHDETWPAAPRPNALLPLALQRARHLPHSSAAWELGFAQRMMAMWGATAGEIAYSWASREGDTVLRPSRLLAGVEESAPTKFSTVPVHFAPVGQRDAMEFFDDDKAPALDAGYLARGGATVLTDQAACPFKAFARARLEATALDPVRMGLDARERGTLLHHVMAALCERIDSQARLLSMSEGEVSAALEAAVQEGLHSVLRNRPDLQSPAFQALEATRQVHLVRQFLDLEKQRAPYRVAARELSREVDMAGLRLGTRIDRIDELEGGGRVILDYKTSDPKLGAWFGERPDNVQLPLYVVTDAGPVDAVAAVQVKNGSVAFVGLSREQGLLPDISTPETSTIKTQIENWPALVPRWREVLEALASRFLDGEADVAPKRYPATCRYCDLPGLCRVRERLSERSEDFDDD